METELAFPRSSPGLADRLAAFLTWIGGIEPLCADDRLVLIEGSFTAAELASRASVEPIVMQRPSALAGLVGQKSGPLARGTWLPIRHALFDQDGVVRLSDARDLAQIWPHVDDRRQATLASFRQAALGDRLDTAHARGAFLESLRALDPSHLLVGVSHDFETLRLAAGPDCPVPHEELRSQARRCFSPAPG